MSTATLDRETWLASRKAGVGASDAAAVCGVSPWSTPLEVYLDKLGLIPERPQTNYQRWGLRMERVIAEAYAEETGREVVAVQRVVKHPEVPIMLATPDYQTSDGERPVEIKRVNQYHSAGFGPNGSDEVPHHIMLQVQQQMAVLNNEVADVVALIGHDDLRIYTIPRDRLIIDELISVELEFWGHVERQEPPLPDFTHATTVGLMSLLEPEVDTAIHLGDDARELADFYKSAGEAERDIKKRRDETKARLIHLMGSAELAHLPDGRKVTRKKIKNSGSVTKPYEYFGFNISKK